MLPISPFIPDTLFPPALAPILIALAFPILDDAVLVGAGRGRCSESDVALCSYLRLKNPLTPDDDGGRVFKAESAPKRTAGEWGPKVVTFAGADFGTTGVTDDGGPLLPLVWPIPEKNRPVTVLAEAAG